MDTLFSLGIDVRAYDDVTFGNVAFWNVCLNIPKDLDDEKGHRVIIDKLRERCGIIPPVEFSLVEVFPYFGDLGKQDYKVVVNENLDARIDDEIISKLALDWKPETPSAVIATPIDLVPGIVLYFVQPNVTLFKCEVLMKDQVGAMKELTKIVAEHVDLLASAGRTIRFGDRAEWKFFGILTGDLNGLKENLGKAKAINKVKVFEKIDTNKIV
jgi:hypothetical protein